MSYPTPDQSGPYPPSPDQSGGYNTGGYNTGGYNTGGYQTGGYGSPDQTGGYSSPDQTGSYGYTGIGAYGDPPKPPRKTGRLVLIIALVVVIIGGGVTATILLVNRSGGGSSSAAPPSSQPSPTTQATDPIKGWTTVTNTTADVQYKVPSSWTVQPASSTGTLGATTMSGIADAYPFSCGGSQLIRGEIMSGLVAPQSPPVTAQQEATYVSETVANNSYGSSGTLPTYDKPIMQPFQRGGGTGVLAILAVKTAGTNPCYAPQAQIAVLAMPKADSYIIVVLNNPIGGPHAEKSLSNDQLVQVMNSIQPPAS